VPCLPEGFNECQESLFDFDYSVHEAKKKLDALGFTPAPDPDHDGLVIQVLNIKGNPYRINLCADTPSIKETILKAMEDKKDERRLYFNNIEEYKEWMWDIASSMKCLVDWYREYDGGCHAWMMNHEVYVNLPLEYEYD
jgi:hypothetical protein